MIALATVPLFLNLLVLVAGPVAGERYMVPMILGSVLVAGLMMVPVYWQSASRSQDRARMGVDPIDRTGTAAAVLGTDRSADD